MPPKVFTSLPVPVFLIKYFVLGRDAEINWTEGAYLTASAFLLRKPALDFELSLEVHSETRFCLKFWGSNTFLGVQDFRLKCMFETNFSGQNKIIFRALPPNAPPWLRAWVHFFSSINSRIRPIIRKARVSCTWAVQVALPGLQSELLNFLMIHAHFPLPSISLLAFYQLQHTSVCEGIWKDAIIPKRLGQNENFCFHCMSYLTISQRYAGFSSWIVKFY